MGERAGFSGDGLGCVRGERRVFRDLSFAVAPGGALILAGANGAGKSSLLRLMAGLLPPVAGRLSWDGIRVADDPEAHRARLRFLGHLDALKPALTALENVAFWARLYGLAEPVAAAAAALDRMGLAGQADLPARYLSQGQRRRAALARVLLGRAPLWLLDEPTQGLDEASQRRLEAVLGAHRAAGGIAVVSTHVPLALPGAATLRLDRALPAAAEGVS